MRSLLLHLAMASLVTGCTLPMGGLVAGSTAGGSSGGVQIYPASTTVSAGQGMTFQVSGGYPPYQYQVSGDGTVDTSGDFMAGGSGGSAQVAVSDSYGNTAYASVSVVQSGSSYYGGNGSTYTAPIYDSRPSYDRMRSVGLDSAAGWAPAGSVAARKSPPLRGQVIAENERTKADGSEVDSEFVDTNLHHPVIRMDEDVQGKSVVATRAVVEDQLIAQLKSGFSRSDLEALLKQADAHVSRKLGGHGVYLISIDHGRDPAARADVSALMAKREALKSKLRKIAVVSPRVLATRAPAQNQN